MNCPIFREAYTTTSGAIDTFVKCVALEMPRGIRINVISPGLLEASDDPL